MKVGSFVVGCGSWVGGLRLVMPPVVGGGWVVSEGRQLRCGLWVVGRWFAVGDAAYGWWWVRARREPSS